MKQNLLLFALLILTGFGTAVAQQPVYITGAPPGPAPKPHRDSKVNVTVFGGYNFDETFELYDGGSVYVEDGTPFGVLMGFSPDPRIEVELTWQKQVSNANAYYYYYIGNNIEDGFVNSELAIEYFMVGVNRIKEFSDRVSGYGGFSLGLCVTTPRENNLEASEKFAIALRCGLNVHLSDRIGLKLQPQLYMPIQSFGGSVYIGTGGSGVGVSGYSTITQFGGIGGLTFSF